MALKTLVANPPHIATEVIEFLQGMTLRKGAFALAMLVPSATGLSDRWNLVLSALWIDKDGLGTTIPAITSELLKHLSKVNAHKLERISVLPTADPLVLSIAGLGVPLGEVHQLQYFPRAEDALILIAESPQAARGYNPQPVRTRA